jgi:Ca2+-binding RTX toxin-like protein
MSWDIEGIEGTSDKIRVYRDGKVVGTTTQSWDPDGAEKYDLILGYGPDNSGYDKFIVDNLIIWDYAKTDFSSRFNEDPEGSDDCNCTAPGVLKGTPGQDFLYGTEHADIICGFGDQDFIAGMGGDDCIDGGGGDDWIYGGRGDDRLFGRSGEDVIYGDRGNDEINGNEDQDFLFGGSGNDRLDGGEGYDWLFCGDGTDEGSGEYAINCEN